MAGQIKWSITRGVSQSGNFIRAFLHLGFNQDEKNRMVYDGAWPIIAGRRAAIDFRWAMPDGVLKLYEPGSEGPQWWVDWPDPKRGLPTNGILHRCTQTNTCPKIIEHFGAAEVWGLKLTPEWVGTNADVDIPLPSNVRRYYIPSTQHGGGNGGFSTVLAPPPSCPSNGYGTGTFPANPVPHTETRNAIQFHFRNWVMQDIAPPPSMYPTLNGPNHELVAPTKQAMGFPTIPGVPASAPTGLINPVLDYDFGPQFNYSDATGVPTTVPPIVKQVIPAVVPRVDIDGNEIGGVPVVLRLAPLGTYLGWNITAAGFNKDKICNYAGGMIPFAKTLAERMATGDPRLSLQERYGNHAGYVAAVQIAADKAVASGFLLAEDAKALVAQAAASDVLNDLPATDGSVRVVEFTRAASGQYFVTADQAEVEALDRTSGAGAWTRTGQQFRAWPRTGSAPSGAVNVCRVAGVPNVGPTDHLFSADANECAALVRDSAHWINEGTAFRTITPQNGQCPAGYDIVLRMWKPASTLTGIRHRLLTDPTQVVLMLAAGWAMEGPVFCSPK